MTRNIQIALQGGGAKLVGLIAALEGLEPHCKGDNPAIKVTRISGTSAGAIAAVLFAAGVPMAQARTHFRGLDSKKLFRKSGYFSRLSLLSGNPLYDIDAILKPNIDELLKMGTRAKKGSDGIPRFLSELDIPTLITVSDIQERRPLDRTGGDSILQAVVDSCALPFLLKSLKSVNNPCHVDGGICANLPAEMLETGAAEYGPIIAFSFRPDPVETPDGIFGYAKSLLFTSIDSNVDRVKKKLGKEFVHEIVTHIKTLDFAKVLGPPLGELNDHLNGIAKGAEDFLSEFIRRAKEAEDENGKKTKLRNDPWLNSQSNEQSAKQLTAAMQGIFAIHTAATSTSRLRFDEVRISVVANSLRALDGHAHEADAISHSAAYEVMEGYLVSHILAMGGADSGTNILESDIELREIRNGQRRPFDEPVSFLPASNPSEPDTKYLVMAFKSPLTPATKYGVTCKDMVNGYFTPLIKDGVDELFAFPTRSSEQEIRIVEFIMMVPKLKSFTIIMEPHKEAVAMGKAGRELTEEELSLQKQACPPNFRPIGWRWENTRAKGRYVVALRAIGKSQA